MQLNPKKSVGKKFHPFFIKKNCKQCTKNHILTKITLPVGRRYSKRSVSLRNPSFSVRNPSICKSASPSPSPVPFFVIFHTSLSDYEYPQWQTVIVHISYPIRSRIDMHSEQIRIIRTVAVQPFLQKHSPIFWVHIHQGRDEWCRFMRADFVVSI